MQLRIEEEILPASFSFFANIGNLEPLLVNERSSIKPNLEIAEIRDTTFLLSNGSPPVIRILFTPNDADAFTILKISSKVRISDLGFQLCVNIPFVQDLVSKLLFG